MGTGAKRALEAEGALSLRQSGHARNVLCGAIVAEQRSRIAVAKRQFLRCGMDLSRKMPAGTPAPRNWVGWSVSVV